MIESKPLTQPLKTLPFILIGLGVILIGGSAFLILRNTWLQNDFSTVPVKVHYSAPELRLTDTDGISRSLTDYHGQVVLVNLWATWCIPCTKEMPALQSFYDKYKDRGFVVIAVNDGNPKPDVLQFIEDYDLTFPVWLDPTYTATEQAFKAMNLPSSFVIDRDGTIQFMWVGGISREMLETHIAPLIKNK